MRGLFIFRLGSKKLFDVITHPSPIREPLPVLLSPWALPPPPPLMARISVQPWTWAFTSSDGPQGVPPFPPVPVFSGIFGQLVNRNPRLILAPDIVDLGGPRAKRFALHSWAPRNSPAIPPICLESARKNVPFLFITTKNHYLGPQSSPLRLPLVEPEGVCSLCTLGWGVVPIALIGVPRSL